LAACLDFLWVALSDKLLEFAMENCWVEMMAGSSASKMVSSTAELLVE